MPRSISTCVQVSLSLWCGASNQPTNTFCHLYGTWSSVPDLVSFTHKTVYIARKGDRKSPRTATILSDTNFVICYSTPYALSSPWDNSKTKTVKKESQEWTTTYNGYSVDASGSSMSGNILLWRRKYYAQLYNLHRISPIFCTAASAS